GGMRLTTYDSAVTVKSGPHGCSEIAAPPTTSRRSSTVTLAPRLARRPAATRPLWPPPITTTVGAPAVTARRLPTGSGGTAVEHPDELPELAAGEGELEHHVAVELD